MTIVRLDQKETNSGSWAETCQHVAALWPMLREYSVRKGLIRQCYDIIQARGLYWKSGGTHAQGTAVDIVQVDYRIPLVWRLAGFPATWRRGPIVGDNRFKNHTHGATDCPCWSGADYQITEVEKLADDGMVGTGPDYEARPDIWRDWYDGRAWLTRELNHLRQPIRQVAVDGDFGPQTVARLQQWTGASVHDGDFGQQTKRLLQGWIDVPQDGVFGPVSVSSLQRYIGTTVVDGKWGPQTTRTLQNFLNTHR